MTGNGLYIPQKKMVMTGGWWVYGIVLPTLIHIKDYKGSFTIWLFNIAMGWKDPPFLSSVSHLFRLGPWLNHGELLVITRG